ncbi:HAMP domain-containing sensor histidine kinase [Aquibacillus rhizosphaerae]|uniref:Signal transduction histidine-protein kinase ArlS n=1 Tax=Aquibacillus rhizosphaerae TaxID=3051431 RepID=A0ABT7L7K9_9BACI|nr:HAMP domain-containing histidine kinase [Aquibacillus sp. LR5S19]MDL4840576.1 HAMP domain-containing histidine kinase [Aquibacillus sp. LR5S19]
MKIRTKMQLFLTLIMVIVIILINTAIYFLFYKTSIDAEIDRVQTQANSMMEAFANNQEEQADQHQLLKAYIPANGMVRIINEQGDVVQSVSKQADFYNLPFSFVRAESTELIKAEDGTRHAVISIPFIWGNGDVMTLQVTEHLVSLHRTMDTLLIVLLLASLIMIIPAIIASRWLSNLVLKPIHQLTEAMTNNPRQGEWKKITINNRSKDELYQMGTTYNQMIGRLTESFERQEQFVSDASHELKTPIAVISSYTQLLGRWGKEKPEVFEEAVLAIRSESERMKHLTEQMLVLAKNQQSENLTFENTNIISLIQEVVRALSVAHNRKIIMMTDNAPLHISIDKEKISQSIYILTDNACKYSEQDVHVTVNYNDQELQIAIEDFGEGLSEAESKRIFDRFYRVDKARSRHTGGSGLGLSIALDIIHKHGGTIKVTSKQGEGSVFTVHLPR